MNRALFHSALFIALLTSVGCNKPVRVLTIIGGHSYDTSEFHQVINSLENIDIDTVSHPHALELLDSELIKRYDVLLFYDFIPDMPEEKSAIFLELTQQGMPMFFLHHSLCTFQNWDGYRDLVGGRYVMPKFESDSSLHSDFKHDIDLEVKVADPDHPVTEGVSDFTIHDEGYSNTQVNKNVHPLLTTQHPDCDPLLGWVNKAGNSTSIYLMLGHDRQAYENRSFQLLTQNAIHWLSEQ